MQPVEPSLLILQIAICVKVPAARYAALVASSFICACNNNAYAGPSASRFCHRIFPEESYLINEAPGVPELGNPQMTGLLSVPVSTRKAVIALVSAQRKVPAGEIFCNTLPELCFGDLFSKMHLMGLPLENYSLIQMIIFMSSVLAPDQPAM